MTDHNKKNKYQLQSLATGRIFEDTGWILEDPQTDKPGLIRALYAKKQIDVRDELGFYKYADWLPVSRFLNGSSAPVTYKSEGLAGYLGLENLYITFSGYWPEKGANMRTCSFKETEAFAVCARLAADTEKILVVASAGNTARAFARVCSDNDIPLLLCVPEDRVEVLWFDEPVKDCVKLIASGKGSDYFDAIHLSNLACQLDQFIMEGGAKNIARRDGMGTTMLSATTTIGKIPDYYFQAVGSGTGAIAAWEANLRLIEDGRFGNTKMKLFVSQNEPFIPLYHAWNKKSRTLDIPDEHAARVQVSRIDAKVLSNRKPPYGLAGGLFDALTDTGGEVLTVSNEAGRKAARLFLELEGNDLHPAAAIATASLIAAVREKQVEKDSMIMLNITGGGEERFKREKELFYLKPEIIFDIDPSLEEVRTKLKHLF